MYAAGLSAKGSVREREEERGTSRHIPPSYSVENRRKLKNKSIERTNPPNRTMAVSLRNDRETQDGGEQAKNAQVESTAEPYLDI